jgi:hypothetical protein
MLSQIASFTFVEDDMRVYTQFEAVMDGRMRV